MVARGIFVDVEMRKSTVDHWDQPRMIGVLVDGEYTAYACREYLRTSVDFQKKSKPEQNWEFEDASTVFSLLMDKAKFEDRRIIAYSNHEKKVMNAIFPEKRDLISSVYFDANMRKWFQENRGTSFRRLRRNNHQKFFSSVGLKDFLGLDYVGYSVPTFFLGFSPAKALSNLEDHINRHGEHANINWRRKVAAEWQS